MKHKTQQIQTKNNLKRNPLPSSPQTSDIRILRLPYNSPNYNKINRNTHKTHQKNKRKLKIKKKKEKRKTKKLKKQQNKKAPRKKKKKKIRRFIRKHLLFLYQLNPIKNRLNNPKKKNLVRTKTILT